MFFIREYSSGSRRPGFLRIESGIPIFADIVEKRGNFKVLEFRFFQTELLTDAHTPIPRGACCAHRY